MSSRATSRATSRASSRSTAGGIALWTPLDLAGIRAALDYRSGVTTAAGVVQSWADGTGDYTFARALTCNATLESEGVRFRGTGNLRTAALVVAQNLHVFVRARNIQVSGAHAFPMTFGGSDNAVMQYNNANQVYWNCGGQIDTGAIWNESSGDPDQWFTFDFLGKGATSRIAIDGTSKPAANAGAGGINGLAIGAKWDGDNASEVVVKGLYVVEGELSGDDYTLMTEYLEALP